MDNLRLEIIKRRDSISLEQRAAEEKYISERLESLINRTDPRGVLCFYPLPGEVDLRIIYQKLLDESRSLYFPVTEKNSMFFYKVKDLTDFSEGKFKVFEPIDRTEDFDTDYKRLNTSRNAYAAKTPIGENNKSTFLAIVPGLYFDIEGNRMGYGKGFYDRFLSTHENIIKVGVCFFPQFAESVPNLKPTDISMDIIITGRSVPFTVPF